MYILYNNELYHHGVQGQKHGVRNAEWYPIDKWKASLKRQSNKVSNAYIDYKKNQQKKRKAVEEASQKKIAEMNSKYEADLKKVEERLATQTEQTKNYLKKEGTPEQIQKAQNEHHYFSAEELNEINRRFDAEATIAKKVASLSSDTIVENKSVNERVNAFLMKLSPVNTNVKIVTSYMNTGIEFYKAAVTTKNIIKSLHSKSKK